MAWAVQGQIERAVPDLEKYLAHAKNAHDLGDVAQRVAQLRQQAG